MIDHLPHHGQELRVCFFFAVRHVPAMNLMQQHFPDAEWYDTAGDDGAYWRWLSKVWDEPDGRDLLVVEGDILVHELVQPQLLACPEHWCEFRHPLRGDPHGALTWKGLGCDRYSAWLRAKVPSSAIVRQAVADQMPDYCWHQPGIFRWNAIDGPLYRALEAAGYECHEHRPPVGHLP